MLNNAEVVSAQNLRVLKMQNLMSSINRLSREVPPYSLGLIDLLYEYVVELRLTARAWHNTNKTDAIARAYGKQDVEANLIGQVVASPRPEQAQQSIESVQAIADTVNAERARADLSEIPWTYFLDQCPGCGSPIREKRASDNGYCYNGWHAFRKPSEPADGSYLANAIDVAAALLQDKLKSLGDANVTGRVSESKPELQNIPISAKKAEDTK